MIGKIDGKEYVAASFQPGSSSDPPKAPADFQTILRHKMAESGPLDRIIIEYLSRAITSSFFSRDDNSQEDSFFPPPIFLEAPACSSAQNASGSLSPAMNPQRNKSFDSIIQRASEDYGVDPRLIAAVIQAESGGDPAARSSAGAMGLMQLMPGTAAELGLEEPFDPRQNITTGTRYLKQLLDRYRGDIRLALAAYNWGLGNLESRPEAMPRETRDYVAKVERLYYGNSKA